MDNSSECPPGLPELFRNDPRWCELRARDERLEALNSLVDHLAHDFNNMLVPLLGYVTLLKEELGVDSAAMLYVSRMEDSARKSEASLEGVLEALHPRRRFNPFPGDLADIVRKAVEDWQRSLPGMAHIAVKLALAACPCVFDPVLMAGLLRQVLATARYALALGGTLEISLRPLEPHREEDSASAPLADACELVIADTGIGMSPDVLNRACEPFFSTRPRGQAAGLGLTAVHSITRLHGGQLLLESTEEVGTRIVIRLPIEGADTERAVPTKTLETNAAASQRGWKVMVVDDDPLVLEAVKTYLQRLPAEVTVAADGVEALKLFQRDARNFAVIVSDIRMPNMNGLELYEQVREIDPEVPFIWMSGDSESALEEALTRFGPVRPPLIRKPFGLEHFLETIRARMR